MSEAVAQDGLELALAGGERAGGAAQRPDRRFYAWLATVALVHALLLVGFNASKPRRLGDARGVEDAISVDFVSEADLKGHATVAERGAGLPVPPTPMTPPAPEQPVAPTTEPMPQQAQPQPPPEQPAAEEPLPQSTAAPAPAPADAPALRGTALPDAGAAPARQPDATSETAKPREMSAKANEPVEQAARPPEPKARQPKQQPTQTAKLSPPSPPPSPQTFIGSGGAGVERPPGITRSGENDAFARGVIRALQGTMPQLRNTIGRVTVRITLDDNGNLIRTEVVRPSNFAGLDQSVVFATKQTNFPIPPRKHNSADLIFVVTYIYH